MNTPAHRTVRCSRTLPVCVFLLSIAIVSSACGCSLFVMAGKAIFGDPIQPSKFSTASGVDLSKGMHRVLVVASTPEGIKSEFPAVEHDLLEQVTRRIKINGVKVVNTNEIATWLDDNGGYWENIDELAQDFDAEFIVHVNVQRFEIDNARSNEFLQGISGGTVEGFEIRTTDRGGRHAHRIFNHNFEFKYPEEHPKLADRTSRDEFHREFLNRISTRVSLLLYNHRASESLL